MTHTNERNSWHRDGDAVFTALELEYDAMARSGVLDGEEWFLAGFSVEEATNFSAYGFSAVEARRWEQLINADLRKRRNSVCRWRGRHSPMTRPVSTSSAANRVVVPWRL